jgi:hypothetical protein
MVMAEVDVLLQNDSLIKHEQVSVSALNLLLATSEFGKNYFFSNNKLKNIFFREPAPSYFTLISLLYYIKNHSFFLETKLLIEKLIVDKLVGRGNKIIFNSDTAHLFLDILSCPYVSEQTRQKSLRNYLSIYELGSCFDDIQIKGVLNQLQSRYWFVRW